MALAVEAAESHPAAGACDRRLNEVVCCLEPSVGAAVREVAKGLAEPVEEVRLRSGRPIQIVTAAGDWFIGPDGRATERPEGAPALSEARLAACLGIITGHSLFAWERELREGFLTLPGGHRVGVVGRAVTGADGRIETIKHFSGLAVRVARDWPGIGLRLVPWLWPVARERPLNALIASPPGAGKTTLLRDLVRLLSSGSIASPGSLLDGPGARPGLRLGLVDERGEIAACHRGQPTHDVGPRTDVLDGCPKAPGLMMLLRGMSPQVLATDEIGLAEDVRPLGEAARAGVTVLATVHAASPDDLASRPEAGRLWREGHFDIAVFLGRALGPGTVTCIAERGATSGRVRTVFQGPVRLAELPSPGWV